MLSSPQRACAVRTEGLQAEHADAAGGRPAMVYFGLGDADACDVTAAFALGIEPIVRRNLKPNQRIVPQEP